MFTGRTDAVAETPILWPPHAKSWLIGKDPDAGRDWRQEEKGTTEDEMAGWHHWLDAHEFGWTAGVGDEQGGLVCCNSWGLKELDMTEWMNWTCFQFFAKWRNISRELAHKEKEKNKPALSQWHCDNQRKILFYSLMRNFFQGFKILPVWHDS